MLFQTTEFLWLMLAVLAGVVLLRTQTLQLVLILVASWVFYASWEPAFLSLLLYCTVNDYLLGIAIGGAATERRKKVWLVVSLVTNLGVLAIFKYANFFVDTLNDSLLWLGRERLLGAVDITLPVGISFYTFHSMGYNIDVYRGRTPPERSFLRFAIYVAFFPQLVAGPILRAGQFLPQLAHRICLDAAQLRSGANLFLVGLVKKVVVADNVAPFVDQIFGAPRGLPSLAIWLGAAAFAIQIYCDFSGYTDMARGVARMLGYEIPINFRYPYLATTITDFWRRWHISLSSWLRDYLYIPLGGNRGGTRATYVNLILTMGLGGLWHGASWNFVLWGLYQGFWLALERALGIGAPPTSAVTWPLRVLRWAFTFYLVLLGWIFFRVTDSGELAYCVRKFVLFDGSLAFADLGLGSVNLVQTALVMFGFAAAHLVSFRLGGAAVWLDGRRRAAQLAVWVVSVVLLVLLWPSVNTAFIYFQF
jgi:alginate O-acetyltransferase complex protein AlgI